VLQNYPFNQEFEDVNKTNPSGFHFETLEVFSNRKLKTRLSVQINRDFAMTLNLRIDQTVIALFKKYLAI